MSMIEILDAARQATRVQQASASWLVDPTMRHDQRWWDGERWTSWVVDGGQRSEDAVDLGQDGPDWRARWDNDAIRGLRDEVLAKRFGLTPSELVAMRFFASDPDSTKMALRLLRTPREQVKGLERAPHAELLNRRNADLMARGQAVALVHCKHCGAVVNLSWDGGAKRYRCPANHKFQLDDVTLSEPAHAKEWCEYLAAQPARKGVRL